jgi:uncharacterized membrane protein
MIYNILKILHIFSAALLISSIGYSFIIWRDRHSPRVNAIISNRIQTQTWLVIMPSALLQMATGFTMIGLQEEDISQLWIVGSIIGFILFIASWFSFIYFLLLAQQVPVDPDNAGSTSRYKFFRRAQTLMLALSAAALLSMIFFMANKVS